MARIRDGNPDAIGVLVVGAGFLGAQRAAAAAKAVRGMRLIGVVDVDRARASEVAARHGGVAVASLEEGLALEGVDAVVVATPHADHVDSVELSLASGKHVLCEKPLAIDAGDARRLADQAEDAGLTLAVGFNHRFYPPVRDLIRLVESGRIGRLAGLRVEIGHAASDDFLAGWHGDRAVSGGGTLIDNGVHACDLIRRLAGEVETVSGRVVPRSPDHNACESEAYGLFSTCDDVVAELHSSWNLRRGYLTVEARGDRGWLAAETAPWRIRGRLVGGRQVREGYLSGRLAEKAHRLRFGCERSLADELGAFVGTIAGRPGLAGNSEDGCRATEMVLGLYSSDRRRSEVGLATRLAREDGRPDGVRGVRSRTGGRA